MLSNRTDVIGKLTDTGFAKLPDYNRQKIISYLSVFELLKVGAVSRGTRKWVLDNCDKCLMREGRQVRRLGLNEEMVEECYEMIQLSDFMIRLTDMFVVSGRSVNHAYFVVAKVAMFVQIHKKKCFLKHSIAKLTGALCVFVFYPDYFLALNDSVFPESIYIRPGFGECFDNSHYFNHPGF